MIYKAINYVIFFIYQLERCPQHQFSALYHGPQLVNRTKYTLLTGMYYIQATLFYFFPPRPDSPYKALSLLHDHTHTHTLTHTHTHSIELWTSDQPHAENSLPANTQHAHTHKRQDIYVPGGIGTRASERP
jgi:hypothetical protein